MKAKSGKSRIPSSTMVSIIVSVIVLLIVVVGGLFLHKRSVEKQRAEWELQQVALEEQVSAAQRYGVYRTIMDVKKGQILSEENVEMVDVLSEDPSDVFITYDDLGKEATVDIPTGQCVTRNMVTSSLTEDWQERELDCIWLSSNLKQYDYVDVRIMYPNGTDYVVLSKKPLRKVDLSVNNVFLWLNEEEILAINAAIVDANLHGGKIYTTKYVKPAIEDAKKANYIPNKHIIKLINSDVNIVKKSEINLSVAAREAMEEKLQEFKKDYSEQQQDEAELGYDFKLDDTTNALGDSDANNHGTEASEDDNVDYSEDENPGLVDSTRNTDVSNEATLEADEEATNGMN